MASYTSSACRADPSNLDRFDNLPASGGNTWGGSQAGYQNGFMLSNREQFASALRRYAALGWKAIPCVVYQSPDKNGRVTRVKQPLIDWKLFQDRPPSTEEIDRWCEDPFAEYAGIELLTGRYNPSLVFCGVDFDQINGQPNFLPYVDDLIDAHYTQTASGGYHYYFRHDAELRNAVDLFNGNKEAGDTIVDFRGQGGVIVVGPTPLWSFDPRSASSPPPTIVARYETPHLGRPEELLPLPSRFIVAMQTKTNIGNEEWRKVFNGKIKEGNRHSVAKSLIAKLLAGVSDADHVAGARDLVYAVLKTQFDGEMPREEIEDLFSWVMAREKQKRSPEYEKAKQFLRDAAEQKALSAWSDLLRPVRAEKRGDLVTFFDKEDVAMRLGTEFYFSQPTFRRTHALEYGVFLPVITQKKFEKIVADIPLVKIVGQSLSLEEVVSEILETLTVAKEPMSDEKKAQRAALRTGYATYKEDEKTILLFPMKSLLPELVEEGLRPKRSELAETFRSLGLGQKKTNSCNLWRYATRQEVGNDPT